MAIEEQHLILKTTVEGNATEAINETTEAVKGLKQQYREANAELLKLQDTPGIDPEEIRKQAQAVGELKDRISEANENAAAFSGNTFENMTTSLGGVKDGLLGLDFGKASEMAKNFAVTAKTISFGDAIKSVKDLGSTFLTLGKALLTNPLFLIAAVIAALVAAIVKVLDKLGILKKITEAVGAAFDFLMGIIEGVVSAITDFLGVTSEAEREATAALERSAAAAEANAKRTSDANEEIIQGINNKIRQAELEGKSTVQFEREKVQALRETAKENYKAAQQAFQLALQKGDLDKKEIADLKEKARQSRLAYAQSKDDVVFFEKEVLKEKEDANKKKQDEDDKAAKTSADKASSARQQALQKQKEYEAARLATSRQIEDLKITLMSDGVEKEIAQNNTKYARLIADTQNNEKLLQTEKDAIVKLYEDQRAAAAVKINEDEAKRIADAKTKADEDAAKQAADVKAQEDALWAEEKARMDLKAQYITDEQTREVTERQNAYAQELVDLQTALDNELITEAEYAELTKAAELKKNEDIDAINEEYAEKEKARRKQVADAALGVASSSLSAISALTDAFAGKSEAQQRKAFKIQKGVQIAQATIDTFKAATGAYSSLSSIPVVGPVLGAVAAAAAIAAGIANIKKISSTEFKADGSGSVPSGGGAPTPTLPSTSAAGAAPTPPSINLFGSALGGSQGQGQQEAGMRQQSVVRAVVVESDITNTQNRLASYQQRAEIG